MKKAQGAAPPHPIKWTPPIANPTAGSVGNLDATQMRSPCTKMHFMHSLMNSDAFPITF